MIGLRRSVVGSSHRSRKTVSTSCTAGPADRGLDVVPRRGVAVLVGHRVERLRVAAVVAVVAARVGQVDAADVGDVAARVVAVPDHDHLLVVRARRAAPACRGSPRPRAPAAARPRAAFSREVNPMALLCERHTSPRTSTPRSSARPSTSTTSLSAVVGQPLVGVALPVGEEHQVTGPRSRRSARTARRSTSPRAPAGAPGCPPTTPLARVAVVEPRPRVVALALGQQPPGDVEGWGHPPTLASVGRRRPIARDMLRVVHLTPLSVISVVALLPWVMSA